jgi:putative endonuclease
MNREQLLGKKGEDHAAKYLVDRGYQIIERNWRCAAGEVDLVALQQDQIVFVEVKTRNGTGFGHPFEAISEQKVLRMRRVAAAWCQANQAAGAKIRLDAIAVLLRGERAAIEHLKQVF